MIEIGTPAPRTATFLARLRSSQRPRYGTLQTVTEIVRSLLTAVRPANTRRMTLDDVPQTDDPTCYPGNERGAAMKRWLGWVSLLVLLFAVAMNMAHIGSSWLWTGVIAAAVLIILSTRKPS